METFESTRTYWVLRDAFLGPVLAPGGCTVEVNERDWTACITCPSGPYIYTPHGDGFAGVDREELSLRVVDEHGNARVVVNLDLLVSLGWLEESRLRCQVSVTWEGGSAPCTGTDAGDGLCAYHENLKAASSEERACDRDMYVFLSLDYLRDMGLLTEVEHAKKVDQWIHGAGEER